MESAFLTGYSPVDEWMDSSPKSLKVGGIVVRALDDRIPSLREVYKDIFPIGMFGASKHVIIRPVHGEQAAKHFAGLSPGNSMKHEQIQPQEGVFAWGDTDYVVDFAAKHGQLVRGHVLVWHQQTADWMFKGPKGEIASREVVIERMRKHIHTVMGRYKGRVFAWDVVNEVIDTSAPNNLRESEYLKIVGPEYIELAFRFAHEADPEALLFVNDYNTYEPAKRRAIYGLVRGLLDKGVPVHGIGMQMHMNIEYPPIKEVEESIKLFSSLGVVIHVTEWDMSVYTDYEAKWDSVGESILNLQAVRYQELFNLLVKYRDVVRYVAICGLGDDLTWLHSFFVKRNDWPLLFDEQLRPKPAFWGAVAAACGNEDWSDARAKYLGH